MSSKYTVQVLQAYLSKTEVPPDELPALIQQVHRSINALTGDAGGEGAASEEVSAAETPEGNGEDSGEAKKPRGRRPKPTPVVPIEEAYTEDEVVCLVCGKRMKSLKRHLKTAHDLDVPTYRSLYNVPEDVPIVAPAFSKQRRAAAQTIGLGKKKKKGRGRAKKSENA